MAGSDDPKARLRELFLAAIAAASPTAAISANLPPQPAGRCLVVGAGKASAAMAQALDRALDQAWPGVPISGVVATRHGHAAACKRIRIIEAGHPVPDARSVLAAQEMLALLRGAQANDLVIALVSGGGSACLTLPIPGMTLAQHQDITAQLLRSGAPIGAINRIRKGLCAVKGGKLAAAAGPARVHSLIISDVPGDDPADIASGPTIPEKSDAGAVLALLDHYRIVIGDDVRALLGTAMPEPVAPRPQDVVRIIASPARSLEAVAALARANGLAVLDLGDRVEGEAADVARDHARLAVSLADSGAPPTLVLSGGETTVTLPADHRAQGGRNTEYQLAMALALEGHPRIWSLAGDSDGIDGVSDAAGALVAPDTLQRARASGLDPAGALAHHRSYDLFAALGDLVMTGPTRTNVNDIRMQLVI